MKKLFVSALAIASLVACSNDELVNADREAIAFDNAFVDNATRSVESTSVTTNDLFNIDVFGFVEGHPLFNNGGGQNRTLLRRNNVSAPWTYDCKQYWIPGAKYDFMAVRPNNTYRSTWTITAEGITIPEIKNFNNGMSDGLSDYLYAQTETIEGKVSENAPVAFTFRHILSKVKFTFENAYNANNTTIQVHDIKILNAIETAAVALTRTTTTWSNWAGSLEIPFGNASTDARNAVQVMNYGDVVESFWERMLIPGAVTGGYKVQFTYDILVGGNLIKSFTENITIPEATFTPQVGHAYDLKAVIKPGQAIEFTVNKLIDWDKDHDGKENTPESDTNGDEQVETPIY